MRYLNKQALGALTTIGLLASGAAAAQLKPAGVPAVAPVGDPTPPSDMPTAAGPSGTSTTLTRFDQVGYADVGSQSGVVASGTGLPVGFAEVTDLATGHTILVKTDATPSASGILVNLSPTAAHLLGLVGGGQVRVRQVDPIAADQVALDQGRSASPRLDAPPILLAGLRAQMAQVPAPAAAKAPAPAIAKEPPKSPVTNHAATAPGASYSAPGKPALPAVKAIAEPKPKAVAAVPKPVAAKPQPKPAATGKYQVRVGAFSSAANARALAAKLGGHVSTSGKFTLVELGPFADAAAAKSARDGAAKRGYGDARVIAN
ncbi:MAG: SPOR domain-containing protein [Sphingomonas sp.]